jgi:NAD kinase
MDRLTENKIILIVRHTRLDELIARFNTVDQARFYIQHFGADFDDYQREDRTYKRSVQETEAILSRLGRVQVVDRTFIPNFIFGETDVVVVLGQDGLVANVLKYLDDQPVIGVNPDPARWEGVLLPFTAPQLEAVVPEVFLKTRRIRRVTMAQADLNTGQILYGVNDLFIGPRSHSSAWYTIEINGRREDQSSSGIIVSTGLGSTGWLRSVLAGATGIAAALTGRSFPSGSEQEFDWNLDHLVFSVREPWPSKTSSAGITFGRITPKTPLRIESHMPENGVIFSDGIEADFLQFTSGTLATISIAPKKGHLVV